MKNVHFMPLSIAVITILQLLTSLSTKHDEDDFEKGKNPENKKKNRYSNIIPGIKLIIFILLKYYAWTSVCFINLCVCAGGGEVRDAAYINYVNTGFHFHSLAFFKCFVIYLYNVLIWNLKLCTNKKQFFFFSKWKIKFILNYYDMISFVVESEMPRLISTVEGHNDYINAVFLPVRGTFIWHTDNKIYVFSLYITSDVNPILCILYIMTFITPQYLYYIT